MSLIGQRVFADVGEQKYLTLANEEWNRPIGGAFSYVRIGVLCAIPTDGTNNLTGTVFTSGITNTAYSQPGSLWGACWWSYSGSSMTYNAGSGNPYFVHGGGAGASGAAWYNSGGGNLPTNTGAIQRKGIVIAEIGWAAVNQFHVKAWCMTAAQAQAGCTWLDLLNAMEQTAQPYINGVAMTFGNWSYNTIVGGPVSGINRAFVYWNRSTLPLEVYGIAVYRFS